MIWSVVCNQKCLQERATWKSNLDLPVFNPVQISIFDKRQQAMRLCVWQSQVYTYKMMARYRLPEENNIFQGFNECNPRIVAWKLQGIISIYCHLNIDTPGEREQASIYINRSWFVRRIDEWLAITPQANIHFDNTSLNGYNSHNSVVAFNNAWISGKSRELYSGTASLDMVPKLAVLYLPADFLFLELYPFTPR